MKLLSFMILHQCCVYSLGYRVITSLLVKTIRVNVLSTYNRPNIFILNSKKTSKSDGNFVGGFATPLYKPKSEKQTEYNSALNDNYYKIIFGIGPAGTGKTLFACLTAIQELKNGSIQKIILTRPVVSADEELGFLPGNLNQKMAPWTQPIFDIFLEHYSKHEVDCMVKDGVIEIAPLAFMRGRTFKRSFIIADEMQNSTPNQLMMLTTRIGTDSRMVITGDLEQTDRGKDNGLLDFLQKYKKYLLLKENELISNCGIKIVKFDTRDVERSPIVSKIIDIYKNIKLDTAYLGDEVPVKIQPNNTANNTTIINPTSIKLDNDSALIPISHITHNSRHWSDDKYNPFLR